MLEYLALSVIASWSLVALLLPLMRRRLLDLPNSRSAHKLPTPRGGGLAFVLVTEVGSCICVLLIPSTWNPAVIWALIPLAAVGLVDDRINLSTWRRYLVQLLTALALLALSPLMSAFLFSTPLIFSLIILSVLIVAITAVINFTNFMDGLDGLVAGCMAIAISVAAIKLSGALSLWILVGALLGFLFWNWSPAKVFMGDVGSTFIGALFAGLVLQMPTWLEAFGLLMVSTPLLADACICVPRRLWAGHRVFEAHRLHLFQRLHQAGWTHEQVAITYIASTAMLAFSFLACSLPVEAALVLFLLLIGFWLDQRIAVSFELASRR